MTARPLFDGTVSTAYSHFVVQGSDGEWPDDVTGQEIADGACVYPGGLRIHTLDDLEVTVRAVLLDAAPATPTAGATQVHEGSIDVDAALFLFDVPCGEVARAALKPGTYQFRHQLTGWGPTSEPGDGSEVHVVELWPGPARPFAVRHPA